MNYKNYVLDIPIESDDKVIICVNNITNYICHTTNTFTFEWRKEEEYFEVKMNLIKPHNDSYKEVLLFNFCSIESNIESISRKKTIFFLLARHVYDYLIKYTLKYSDIGFLFGFNRQDELLGKKALYNTFITLFKRLSKINSYHNEILNFTPLFFNYLSKKKDKDIDSFFENTNIYAFFIPDSLKHLLSHDIAHLHILYKHLLEKPYILCPNSFNTFVRHLTFDNSCEITEEYILGYLNNPFCMYFEKDNFYHIDIYFDLLSNNIYKLENENVKESFESYFQLFLQEHSIIFQLHKMTDINNCMYYQMLTNQTSFETFQSIFMCEKFYRESFLTILQNKFSNSLYQLERTLKSLYLRYNTSQQKYRLSLLEWMIL